MNVDIKLNFVRELIINSLVYSNLTQYSFWISFSNI